jgi:hypothetical protein
LINSINEPIVFIPSIAVCLIGHLDIPQTSTLKCTRSCDLYVGALLFKDYSGSRSYSKCNRVRNSAARRRFAPTYCLE